MEQHLIERIELLIQQDRLDDAQVILSNLLEQNPNNSDLLALSCRISLGKKEFNKAESFINDAIGIAPDHDYYHYLKANVMLYLKQYDDAENCLQDAINITPYHADYFSLWASIKLSRKKFEEALDLANQSLELDAENILGLNIRSSALLKLDKKDEAFNTIDGALEEDPNNAYTHANYGWGLLEKGNHKKALEHFKESLKNDPNNRSAQAGMIEALKAKYFIYRVFLKYAFWMGNLTAKYQWGVIIGFYLGVRALNSLADNNPSLSPILNPIVFVLALIAFSTWVITPLSNLFLRLNVYGKHLLDRKEILSSNFVGISFFLFLTGLISYLFIGGDQWFALAAFGFTMMVPLSVMLSPSKYKNSLLIYTILMGIVGLVSIANSFDTGELLSQYSTIYLIGFVGFQWGANFLMIKEDNF